MTATIRTNVCSHVLDAAAAHVCTSAVHRTVPQVLPPAAFTAAACATSRAVPITARTWGKRHENDRGLSN